jgi:hypothetical protein
MRVNSASSARLGVPLSRRDILPRTRCRDPATHRGNINVKHDTFK